MGSLAGEDLQGAVLGQDGGRRRAAMSDRGEVATGKPRSAAARPGGIQPEDCPPGSGLRVPRDPGDILCNVPPDVAEQGRELQESPASRAADKELRDELESAGFAGPKYRLFEEELTRYAMSVRRAWMYTGRIFKLTAARGHTLYPTDAELEDLHCSSDTREGLAAMTVSAALPRFRQQALIDGGWSVEGGASLGTYFMGACLYAFPNEFRRARAAGKAAPRGQPGTGSHQDRPGRHHRPGCLGHGRHPGPRGPSPGTEERSGHRRTNPRRVQPGRDQRDSRCQIRPGSRGRTPPLAYQREPAPGQGRRCLTHGRK